MQTQNSRDALPGDNTDYAATGYWTDAEFRARYRTGRAYDYVVIHHTAGSKRGDLATLTTTASVHKYVTKNGERYHLLDDAYGAWGCGTLDQFKTGIFGQVYSQNENIPTLQIELENLGNGQDPFTDAEYEIAAEWTAHWCVKYGIPVTRQRIVGHYEIATNKSDPAKNFDWDKFMALVESKAQPPKPEIYTDPETGFDVIEPFLTYWESRGGIPIFGRPKSGEAKAKDYKLGYEGSVQWFERARFEWHDAEQAIMLGLLGSEALEK
jgi:N-acetyl-anhydromuramyl-L-alanine amidase AmpD